MARRRKKSGDARLVVGYIRVSKDDQALSPAAQLHELEQWCKRHRRKLVEVYSEAITSKVGLDKRHKLQDAIVALPRLGAGAILVWRQDRLARDVHQATMIERMVADVGGRILSTDGVGNDDTAESVVLKRMMQSFAEYERTVIAMRTKLALGVKKRKGQRHNCRAEYGKQWARGLAIDCPHEQRSIAFISHCRADKVSIVKICAALNSDKRRYRPRGRRWYPTTVYRIAQKLDA